MYAEDHQIFASGSSTSIVEGKLLLLSEGSKITRWYKENLLQVNVQKHQSMELGAESETNNINLHIDAVKKNLSNCLVYSWTLNLILVSTSRLCLQKG